MDGCSQEKNLRPYAELFFTGEGSANVQKILIAENALGYKLADRHHGKTGLRDRRKGDVSEETTYETTMN